VERDIDLRNWLFGFGAGIRIEAPAELRQEHRQKLEATMGVYQAV
jgi:predicted DNA-binding transcriptional regulator YafY